MPKKKCGEKSMIWIEALAKLIFIMMMLAILVTGCVVLFVVIRAIIEALIKRWRRKHGD